MTSLLSGQTSEIAARRVESSGLTLRLDELVPAVTASVRFTGLPVFAKSAGWLVVRLLNGHAMTWGDFDLGSQQSSSLPLPGQETEPKPSGQQQPEKKAAGTPTGKVQQSESLDDLIQELNEEQLAIDPTPHADLPDADLPVEDLPIGEPSLDDQADGGLPGAGIDLPFFGRTKVSDVGMPAFTIAVGLVDGFNPCAMWVLLFLLSILVNLKDRTRILVVAGTFVLISGLAYFVFMAAWLQVFMLVGLLRPIQIFLGLMAMVVGAIHIKDFFAFKKGVSLSIPESAKPGIYRRVRAIINAENLAGALVAAGILAVLVNVIELLCTAGLPALYTEILTLQEYSLAWNYAYLGLYILCYMFDDALMVGIVTLTLSKKKLQEDQGRWLKLVSGLVIFLLGALMLFFPSWLF